MSDYAEFVADGRAALLAGDVAVEPPPVDGGLRWGLSAVLRPSGPEAAELAALARSVGAVAGPGQVVHDESSLHLTLRSLSPYRSVVPDDDAHVAAFAAALAEAAEGREPVRVRVQGIAAHAGGVLGLASPVDGALGALQAAFGRALHARGVGGFEHWTRDLWYVSLVHFFSPVRDPAAVVAWADQHRSLHVGVVEIDTAEIAHWWWADGRMHNRTLAAAPLGAPTPARSR